VVSRFFQFTAFQSKISQRVSYWYCIAILFQPQNWKIKRIIDKQSNRQWTCLLSESLSKWSWNLKYWKKKCIIEIWKLKFTITRLKKLDKIWKVWILKQPPRALIYYDIHYKVNSTLSLNSLTSAFHQHQEPFKLIVLYSKHILKVFKTFSNIFWTHFTILLLSRIQTKMAVWFAATQSKPNLFELNCIWKVPYAFFYSLFKSIRHET